MRKRFQHGPARLACAIVISILSASAWAQWPTAQWLVQPVIPDASNPGWVDDGTEKWTGSAPAGITVDSARDTKNSARYKKSGKKNAVETLKITPADRAVIRTGLEHASAMLQAEGFKAPLLEKRYQNYWLARIFPDPYIYDHGMRDTTDYVWGMYLSHKDRAGVTGRLYVANDWRDDTGATVIHELFHAVSAAYPGHNAPSGPSREECVTACWITEGMAEGFAAHWMNQGGSDLLDKPYTTPLSRSFEQPLPATDYQEGQNTAPFWTHVANRHGLRTLADVLEQAPSLDDAVTSTDQGLRAAGHKGLTPIFVQFVSEKLRSPNDFGTIPVFMMDEKEPEAEGKIKIEPLAARAFRVKVELDHDQEGQLTIDASDGGEDAMHLLVGDQVFGHTTVIPVDGSRNNYDFFVRLVNADPDPAETEAQQPNVVVTLDLFDCGMMPSKNVRMLHYQQFDAGGTPLAKIEYDFSNAIFSGRSVKNVKMRLLMQGKGFSSDNEATFSYECTSQGVVSDGTYAMHGMKLPGVTVGKTQGKMTLKQEHNTLSLPNRPVANETLPDGSAAFSAGIDGAPLSRISVKQTNRKIAGREIIKVPGAGDLNTWKMTATSSFGMDIDAAGAMSGPSGPANVAGIDIIEFITAQSGGSLGAGEKAALSGMLAQVGKSGAMKDAMSMLSGAIAQQATGTETLWFYRGIGMVQHKSSNPQGESSMQLMKVEYR